jgi:uncharacterized protein with GYD domain
MATYIVLINYTDKGIQTIKDSPARLASSKEEARSFGCEVKAFYLTMGAYDIIEVIEAPDDRSIARLTLAVASGGNIRTTTLRAFPEAEFKSIVESLPT